MNMHQANYQFKVFAKLAMKTKIKCEETSHAYFILIHDHIPPICWRSLKKHDNGTEI